MLRMTTWRGYRTHDDRAETTGRTADTPEGGARCFSTQRRRASHSNAATTAGSRSTRSKSHPCSRRSGTNARRTTFPFRSVKNSVDRLTVTYYAADVTLDDGPIDAVAQHVALTHQRDHPIDGQRLGGLCVGRCRQQRDGKEATQEISHDILRQDYRMLSRSRSDTATRR